MTTAKRFIRSDRETLRLVLKFAKLSPAETVVFTRMYDELAAGQRTELSDGDRMRVQSVFDQHGVSDTQYASLGEARNNVKARKAAAFDAMPRPKRPPGK
jgi:hypothetical protein